ncbi:MAG: phosphotransferase, partial [Chloroflexi bacterium]|nr:phosphotransferase [Chloroflexota bacterium]
MHEHEFDDLQELQEDLLDLNEIMQAFGIYEWKNLGAAETSHTGDLNLLVDVQGQRYVLRERPEGLIGEDISHRYDFQRYLRDRGIPIPLLWLTPQGEPAVALGEDYFELQQWVGGEQFSTLDSRSLDWVAFAGTMLGRIHEASSQYPGHEHRWPSEAHVGSMVQGWLNLARNKADECEIHAIAAALSNWADQWEAVLPAAMMSIGAGGALPEYHIHGDYHALNLRFGASGVTAVTGLEASRWEKRIFEVAYALFYFSALAWQPGENLTRPLVKRGFDPERARRFLQAYGEICPPVRGEAALLADALSLISPVATINGPLEDLFYAQEEPDEALIDDVLERLSWAASLPAWLRRVRR